mmetsp:Transcript_4618/g.8500  ORF Transcript_4618/g.8500 Transcript_4618/m.8500 type:complete len:80 (-) Transcript_4618:74-313(-)
MSDTRQVSVTIATTPRTTRRKIELGGENGSCRYGNGDGDEDGGDGWRRREWGEWKWHDKSSNIYTNANANTTRWASWRE